MGDYGLLSTSLWRYRYVEGGAPEASFDITLEFSEHEDEEEHESDGSGGEQNVDDAGDVYDASDC